MATASLALREGLGWFAAPSGYGPDQPNPFTPDAAYGPKWSCFQLTGADNDRIVNGRHPRGQYHVAVGQRCQDPEERLGDFLRYETAHGRKVIVACPPEVPVAALVAAALVRTAPGSEVRPGDPQWVVHSTPREAWQAIAACGALWSSSRLRETGAEAPPLGEGLVGDPPDYARYVALGRIEAIGPEFVLACRQAGRMLPEPEATYEPGIRLYFDAHAIIADGLAVRDGLHTLKVGEALPLAHYLVARVGADDVVPLGPGEQWTTGLFLQRANELFEQRCGRQER